MWLKADHGMKALLTLPDDRLQDRSPRYLDKRPRRERDLVETVSIAGCGRPFSGAIGGQTIGVRLLHPADVLNGDRLIGNRVHHFVPSSSRGVMSHLEGVCALRPSLSVQ